MKEGLKQRKEGRDKVKEGREEGGDKVKRKTEKGKMI